MPIHLLLFILIDWLQLKAKSTHGALDLMVSWDLVLTFWPPLSLIVFATRCLPKVCHGWLVATLSRQLLQVNPLPDCQPVFLFLFFVFRPRLPPRAPVWVCACFYVYMCVHARLWYMNSFWCLCFHFCFSKIKIPWCHANGKASLQYKLLAVKL